MTNQALHRILIGVLTITLVGAIGSYLLSFIPEGYPKILFAVTFALLIPAIILPRFLNLRFKTKPSRYGLVFLITFMMTTIILQTFIPADALVAAYSIAVALVVTLPVTYFVVTYDVDRHLLSQSG